MKLGYEIIVGSTVQHLEQQVREWIANGWLPLGGVVVDPHVFTSESGSVATEPRYLQAMTLSRVVA